MKAAFRATVRGRVQGVGFRYFVLRRAQLLNLTGWVANRPDGSVEVVAEGESSQLEELLELLRHGPVGSYVTKLHHQPCPWSGRYPDFRVEHGYC